MAALPSTSAGATSIRTRLLGSGPRCPAARASQGVSTSSLGRGGSCSRSSSASRVCGCSRPGCGCSPLRLRPRGRGPPASPCTRCTSGARACACSSARVALPSRCSTVLKEHRRSALHLVVAWRPAGSSRCRPPQKFANVRTLLRVRRPMTRAPPPQRHQARVRAQQVRPWQQPGLWARPQLQPRARPQLKPRACPQGRSRARPRARPQARQ
mmetsp:Transcript_2903/g.8621  ORF Transcript_2903/g.8621 Transcript_2903/m.8621 type:complete len:212 (-) Transcript_2903:2503-3138(-)